MIELFTAATPNGWKASITLEELALVRGPLYRSIAAITIRTDGRAPTAVAGDIARALDKA